MMNELAFALAAAALILWRRAARRTAQTQAELARLRARVAEQQARVAASEKRLAELLEDLNTPAMLLDRQGRIWQANALARSWLSAAEIPPGMPLRAFYRDPDWWEKAEAAFARLPNSSELPRMTLGYRVGEPRLVPFGEQALLIVFDATARVQAEQARQRMFEGLLHDLKTPIAALLGYARSLQAFGEQDAELREEISEAIAQEAKSLSRLLDQLLALEEIAAHPPRLVRCNLHKLLEEAIERAKRRAPRRLRIVHRWQSVPADALADHELLMRALDNVLLNAVQHAQKQIEVAVNEEGDALHISIGDDGPGVPKEALPRLAERFFRVDAARTRQSGAHGLGLAIAKEAIERCKGRLRFRCEHGQGLRVCIDLIKAPASDSS